MGVIKSQVSETVRNPTYLTRPDGPVFRALVEATRRHRAEAVADLFAPLQPEEVCGMIKRTLGAALRACTYWSQSREIVLKVLALNVMILW